MTIGQLIRDLNCYPKDREIEIECPNGLLVEPSIKRISENPLDPCSAVISYVITWQ